jgi:hypothetical protein
MDSYSILDGQLLLARGLPEFIAGWQLSGCYLLLWDGTFFFGPPNLNFPASP